MARTQSEERFEEYLRAHGINYFAYEEPVSRKTKLVDYCIPWRGQWIYCEVKERPEKSEPDGACTFDPFKVWRKKIEKARVKFEEYADDCCAVVCYNLGDLDMWHAPHVIFGAMLGDLGVTESGHNVFLHRGGKMVDYDNQAYQNRTISALIVLEHRSVSNLEWEALVANEFERGKVEPPSDEAAICAIERLLSQPRSFDSILRVIVCQNPGARMPLPRDLFRGAFDERWAIENGRLTQVFRGSRCHLLCRETTSTT